MSSDSPDKIRHSLDGKDHKGGFDEENASPTASDKHLVVAREDFGAGKAEAAVKVWGKYSRWVLYISLGLAAYVYSLDNSTTYFYTAFATSSFSHHSLLASIEVAAAVILAVGKPVIARIADLQSRSFAYIIVVILYVLGYVIIGTSNSVSQFAAGRVFQAAGSTGLQLLTQVIIADITSLRYRGLLSSLMSLPYIINAFVGSKIAASITTPNPTNGWRWGYGMFAILLPCAIFPVISTLAWGERRAQKKGLIKVDPSAQLISDDAGGARGFVNKAIKFATDIDLFGILLLGIGWGLLLIALTLSASVPGKWNNPSIIAMIVMGPIIIIAFAAYEILFAKHPLIPALMINNRAVMCAAFIGFFDFVSFYLTFLYLSSFLYVMKTPAWSQSDQNYFSSTQTVGLTLFGIGAAGLMVWTRRYKWILVVGLCIRCLGVGIMIHSRGADGSDAELVMTQILQAAGGGFAATTIQVGAQASVTHKYVAMVTAIVLMITELGGAIGSAIAGAIWTNVMPANLAKYIPQISQEERDTLFGSIITIGSLDPSDPVRQGAIAAYGDTMRILIIVALVFGLIPIALALLMPNYFLSDAQNAIDGLDIAGRKVHEPEDGTTNQPSTSNREAERA
ncbi:hypothetical protein M408DRAFT_16535 [Serendipita vermifera MAFF 305830]|uniref:Major facilitator superfamily (MFS) profile domain-containing protein n=1 Tax=Serendipita vermifera MAFF 305830 TaxID=933852 RepID=A0A0C3B899_SERVB|nr:hypothetical protein M408DRAFT_16535 [Serendipita vermifera MAFF 305830]